MRAFLHNRHSKYLTGVALLGLAATFTGCGKEAYVVQQITDEIEAPGNYYIPPKVDILLAEDDTGSMNEAYSKIAGQFPTFLKNLESKGWDYHFATTPLTTERPLTQIVGSKYDPNWGSLWKAPFPGMTMSEVVGTIFQDFFRTPDNYTHFLTRADITRAGSEPGLETLTRALETDRQQGQSGFLRNDALLVVLVAGNGDDRSKVNMCTRASDGWVGPCDALTIGKPACTTDPSQIDQYYSSTIDGSQCGTYNLSLQHYQQRLKALKQSDNAVRFYSAVSTANRSNCLGGGAFYGDRYIKMASALNGETYDICTKPITSVLDELSTHLQAEKGKFRSRYIFIQGEPAVASIRVKIYRDGDKSREEVIPQDPENGWTYAGYLQSAYRIDSPILMHETSGYAIELHGSAVLYGNDRANVNWQPAGAENASSN